MTKKIIVDIDKNGEVKIEAQGYNNKECLKATKDLEEALGKVSDRKMKTQLNTEKEQGTINA